MSDSVMASFNLSLHLFTDDVYFQVQSMYIQTFVQNFVLDAKAPT